MKCFLSRFKNVIASVLILILVLGCIESIPSRVAYGIDREEQRETADDTGQIKVKKEAETITLNKKLSKKEKEVFIGNSYKVALKDDTKVIWRSSDESIIRVSKKGKLNLLTTGTVTIKAYDKETKEEIASRPFVVLWRATRIEVPDEIVIYDVGTTATIEVNKIPEDSTDFIVFESSDTEVITVGKTNGTIKAKRYGSAVITVYAKARESTKNTAKTNLVAKVKVKVKCIRENGISSVEDACYTINQESITPLTAMLTGDTLDIPVKTDENGDSQIDCEWKWFEAKGPEADYENDLPAEGETELYSIGDRIKYTPDVSKVGVRYYYARVVIPETEDYLGKTLYSNVAKVEVKAEAEGKVNITFDANGGSFPGGETRAVLEADKGKAIGSYPGTPVLEGKSLAGWASSKTATTPDISTTSSFEQSTTVYAIWKAKSEEKPKTERPKRYAEAPVIMEGPLAGGYTSESLVNIPGGSGGSVRLYIEASVNDGGSFSYQWYKNGLPIEGATSYEYYVTPADFGREYESNEYHVKVTNSKRGFISSSVDSTRVTITLIHDGP